MKNEKKMPEANCESCIHYVYDEIYFAYTCDQALDQDELSSYTYNPHKRCPFYQYKDEYINVRKQI